MPSIYLGRLLLPTSQNRDYLHQQILVESDLRHQQRHRDEQHQLYIDQQEAIHVVNRERSAELHELTLQEMQRKSQAAANNFKLMIQPLTDDEKVEDYLAHFERLTTLYLWDKSTWSLQLAPFL